uniref:hypothetical protein n=1 Tax=Aliarcobacter sp. TaxID=2321116 RepID=UPI0040488120
MEIIKRDIRANMKLLKTGETLCLNGTFIQQIREDGNKFKIEYSYNGQNKSFETSRNWVKNFLKKDYLQLDLYLV